MQLIAAVQLLYLPEKGQQLALSVSKASGISINRNIAEKVRKAPMTEKAIMEAVAGPMPEVDLILGVVEKSPAYKPIKISAGIIEKYFRNVNSKEIEEIIDKALADWFKKKR